jgi:hypothetical protein
MKFSLFTLILCFLISAQAAESLEVVECSTRIGGKKHAVELTIGTDGKIQMWTEERIAKANKSSIFSLLSENFDESGIEYLHFIMGRNGFAMVRAGTTADEITVGVSRDRSRGFYQYRDLGSGNGNSQLELSCKVIQIN